ncbi:MAG: hypothetical protein VW448_03150 [Gammaproteobacteria bacterium]
MPNKSILNLSKYTPDGKLGGLFENAKKNNVVTQQIKSTFPKDLNTLEVCSMSHETITLQAQNQSQGFKASQQKNDLLVLLGFDPTSTTLKIIIAQQY